MIKMNKCLIMIGAFIFFNANVHIAAMTSAGRRVGQQAARVGERAVSTAERKASGLSRWQSRMVGQDARAAELAMPEFRATAEAQRLQALRSSLPQRPPAGFEGRFSQMQLNRALRQSDKSAQAIEDALSWVEKYKTNPTEQLYQYVRQRLNPQNAPTIRARQAYLNMLGELQPPAQQRSILRELADIAQGAAQKGESTARTAEAVRARAQQAELEPLREAARARAETLTNIDPRSQLNFQRAIEELAAREAQQYEQGLTRQVTAPGFESEPMISQRWVDRLKGTASDVTGWVQRKASDVAGRVRSAAQTSEAAARARQQAEEEAGQAATRERMEAFRRSVPREATLEQEAGLEHMKRDLPQTEALEAQEIESGFYP